MTRTHKDRLKQVLFLLFTAAICGLLVVKGLQANMVYFISPSDTMKLSLNTLQSYRIGGTVETGSIKRMKDGVSTRFLVTDCSHAVTVEYKGILPDLFREGQGVIADGKINDQGVFIASTVLAKHDENYVPQELAHTLLDQQDTHCQQAGII